MRINKYLAHRGVASRRKAEELVKSGNVKVNNEVIRDLSFQVGEDDEVWVNGKKIEKVEEKKVYFLLNKPKGYVTTVSDDKNRLTVVDLLTDVSQRVFPVGRLDYETTGLLIMTNDGEFAYKVSHPRHKITKTYRAIVVGALSDAKLYKLRKGVDIGGFVTSKARVDIIRQGKGQCLVEIEIGEGKNRQVRKMFKAVGCKVVELERIAIGNIKLGRMLEGHYRKMTRQELDIVESW